MRLFDLPGVAAVGLLGLARWTAAQATGDFDIAGPTVASTCAPISLSGSKNLPAAAASSSANAQYKWSIDKSSAVNLTEAGLAALAAGNYGGGIITIPGDAKVGSGNMVVNLRVTYNVTTYPAVATATPSSSATGVVGSSTTVAGGQASITPAPAASSSSTSAGVESGSASSDSLSSGSTVSGNTASTDSTASAGSAPSTQSGTASDAATSSSYSTSSNDGSTASSGSSSTADPGATTASAGTTSSSNVASSGSSTSASEASSATAGLTTSSTAEGSASSTAAAGATSSTSAAESTTSSPAAAGTTSSSSAAELTTSTASSAGIASSITTTNAEPTTSSSAAVSSTSASSIAQPTTSATSSAEASSSSSTAQSTAASTSATSSAEASSFSSTTQSTAASTSATSSAEASSSSSTAQSTAASTSAPSSAEASSSSSTAQSTAASTSATSSAEASSSSSTAQSTAASTSATSSAEASSSSSTAQSTAASTSATSSAEAISSSSTAQSTAASTSSAEITSSSSTAESTTSSASATSSIEITSSSSTAESTTSSASDTSSIETSSSTSAAASTSTEASTSSDASPSTESSVSTITSSDASSSTESSSSTTTFETTTVATTTETTVTTATETTTTGTTETTTTAAPTGLALRRRAEAFKEYVRQRADEKKRNLFRRALVERADPIVNTYTLNAQYTLVISASAPPTVSVSGPETVFVGLGNPLSLTASGVYVTCNSADSAALKYLWTTNATGGFGANSVTTTSKLYVPEGLQADASGSSVTVTVTTVDGKTATKSISVLPIPRAFVANLAGGATRSTGANIPLRLDASASRDNAYPKAVLTYSWTCTSTGACPAAFASNTANFINIPENTLSAGVYNFTVTVGSSGASQTASASTIVDVAANVAIACTAEYDSSNVAANSIISDNVIGIRATCVGDVDTANYRWSSLPGNLVTNTDKVLFGGETNSYVYFKANALAPGSYNFSLVVTVPGSSAQAQAYTIINVLAPPSGGSLTLAQGANPGTAYTTEYKFSAGGWKASTDGDTLRYAYSYTYLSGGRTVESGLSIRSTESEGTFKIPHEGTVNIVVRVFDSKGATTTYAYPTPLVLQPISSAALGEAISASANAIRNAIASGDSQALISASINSAALVSKSNEGGYSSPEAVAAAAQAQAVVVNAMVDLAVNAKDSDTANSCAKALLSNDLSIMDATAQNAALGAVGTLAANIIADTTPGSAPLDTGAGGSIVNTMSRLFPAQTSGLFRRQSVASTYPPRGSGVVTDPVSADVENAALLASHQSGAAMSKNRACIAGTSPLQILSADGTSALATQYVPLTTTENLNSEIGYENARVKHPRIDDTAPKSGAAADRNADAGCTVATMVITRGARNTKDAKFTSPVLSLSYANPTTTIRAGILSSTVQFWLPETLTTEQETHTASCQVWDSATLAFTPNGCTTGATTDGLTECSCTFVSAAALRKRDTASTTYPSNEFVVVRLAPGVTPPAEDDDGIKLSGGAIAGITVGCVVGAAAIVAAGVLVAKRQNRPRTTAL